MHRPILRTKNVWLRWGLLWGAACVLLVLEGCGSILGGLLRSTERRTQSRPVRIETNRDPATLHVVQNDKLQTLPGQTPWEGTVLFTEERVDPHSVSGGFFTGLGLTAAAGAGFGVMADRGDFDSGITVAGFVAVGVFVLVDAIVGVIYATSTTNFDWRPLPNKRIMAASVNGIHVRKEVAVPWDDDFTFDLDRPLILASGAQEARRQGHSVWWFQRPDYEVVPIHRGLSFEEVKLRLGLRTEWGKAPGLYICEPTEAEALVVCSKSPSPKVCLGELARTSSTSSTAYTSPRTKTTTARRRGGRRSVESIGKGCDPSQSISVVNLAAGTLRITFARRRLVHLDRGDSQPPAKIWVQRSGGQSEF